MNQDDHSQTARDFLTASDEEFASGDHLQASEKLWGAATHAVMAVADKRGWQCRSHRAMKNVRRKSSTETSTTTKWRTMKSRGIAQLSTNSFTACCRTRNKPRRLD